MTPKRFRIEDSLRPAGAPAGTGPVAQAAPAPPDERIGAILATVQELRRLTETSAADVVAACRKEITEVYGLRHELDAMKAAIVHTKREIAALHQSDAGGSGMRRVAGELDAVVEATERATTTILTGIEEIETQAAMLRASGLPKGKLTHVDAILERVVTLYESCNFQDLTGQRISKIVGLLKFVEDHIDAMIGAWGGLEAFKDMFEHPASGPDADDPRSLLNGPKLDGDAGHVEQGDIDALFD